MKIKEIIVVEGKDDTRAIHRSVDADTIETNGSALSLETIEQIKLAQQVRGVIILTDPDYPGEKIRQTISQHVPGCKHAFIDRKDALAPAGKRGLGIEHASKEVIQNALKDAHLMNEPIMEEISKDELLAAGLIGGPKARHRRERLGVILKIGYTNGKQLHKRLNMFHITNEEFSRAVKIVLQEEQE